MSHQHSIDVYLGRGPGCYNKPGTKKYRSIIKLYAPDFCPHAPRSRKSTFIDNVWFKMHVQGFRFFVLSASEEDPNIWEEASTFEVKRRIGHALRDYRKIRPDHKTTTNRKANSKGASRKQLPWCTNKKETHIIQECDQRNIIAFVSELPLEDQQDDFHDEEPVTIYEAFNHGPHILQPSNNSDVWKDILFDAKDWCNENDFFDSVNGKVGCDDSFILSHVSECLSHLDSPDLVSLDAYDQNLEGN
jgi:hypothetical protein